MGNKVVRVSMLSLIEGLEYLLEQLKSCKKEDRTYIYDEIEESITEYLSDEGYFIIKSDSMNNRTKIEDFLKNEIYPIYNDQQKYLNF